MLHDKEFNWNKHLFTFSSTRHLFGQEKSWTTSAEFHNGKKILVIGLSTGVFKLYEMPDFIEIHSLR